MNVDDIVAEQITAARIRVQAAKRQRDELAAARRRGLVARHAAKLRNLDAAERRRAAAEKGLHGTETPGSSVTPPDATPDGSIRPTDATPDLAVIHAQLERIADRLDTEEIR
ncbi:hypothetical protein OG912_24840 [Streptomyces sp. NBC_00464]|uniref:hypothetical protein n=1 Tax=Streptomyces sp. NBC_00464 TaxID=2975751 RepID=UPI002E19C79C